MTDITTPATGADAQAAPDAIETILNSAKTQDIPEAQEGEKSPETKEETAEQPWPKKAENALAREKGKSAKYKFQAHQERERTSALEARLAQLEQKVAPKSQNGGAPNEKDFTSYADFFEAKNAYAIEQKFADRDAKQTETQKTADYKAWEDSRINEVDKQAAEFTKAVPEIESLYAEYADEIRELPLTHKQIFLESDNAPQAFYNLAKEGKIEALASMSPARAAMEIGRAAAQAVPKPQSKAPAPLPASRGSVPSSKPIEKLTAREAHQLLSSKD